MLKKILVALVVIVAGLAALIALQPASFVVERSIAVQAPAEQIYPHIESLRAMNEWSPWVKMDPNGTITYDGPDAGVGATSSWIGEELGQGRMTVTSVRPNELVELELEFIEPMAATNRVLFSLAPSGDATKVTWRMEGTNGFAGKAFGLLMNMDELIGSDFEKGLADLKAKVESEARRGQVADPRGGSAPA